MSLWVSDVIKSWSTASSSQTVHTGELGQTETQADRQTDGRYQVHDLPASRRLQSIIKHICDSKNCYSWISFHKWAAWSEKVPNVLSRCHTKKRTGARGRARPSFGMTPTFYNFFENFFWKFFWNFFFILKSRYHTKRRVGNLFAYRSPNAYLSTLNYFCTFSMWMASHQSHV